MPSIVIKTEFGHSYLVVDNIVTLGESYLLKMMLNNKIENLLCCKENYLEDKSQLFYEISNKKSLLKEYEAKTMAFEEIYNLFQQLSQVFTNVSAYLLKQEYFLLDPQYMFLDLETKELNLLYIPFQLNNDSDMTLGIKTVGRYYKLADFILEKINHRDEYAVNIAYQFYKMSKEDYFSISSFINYIEKERVMKESVNNKQSVVVENEIKEDDVIEKALPRIKTKNIKIWIIPACLGVFSILSIIIYALVKQYTFYASYLFFLSIILALLSLTKCIHNLVCIYRLHTENQLELSMRDSLQSASVEDYWNNNEETMYFDENQEQPISEYTLNWKENGKHKKHIFTQFPITIGKLEGEVDCQLNDTSISRIHAKIIKKENVIKLQDLDSTNGTFVNGVRLYPGEEITIQRKDEIQFGKLTTTVV